MAFAVTRIHGRDLEVEQLDISTGLMLQDPLHMRHEKSMAGVDPAAGADALSLGVSFGTPFVIEVVVNAEETGGAATGVLTALVAGGSDVFPVYDADATALTTGAPFKFKVIDCVTVALDENTKGTDTLQLMKVDDDGTTETAITDAMSMNINDDINVRPTTMDQDACVIDVTENLRLDVILDNSSSTDHRAWKCYITCMRCVASE